MTRLEANLQILRRLKKYVEDNPDERFGQILRNIGIVDTIQTDADGYPYKHVDRDHVVFAEGPFFTNTFYEESVKTLERIENGRK